MTCPTPRCGETTWRTIEGRRYCAGCGVLLGVELAERTPVVPYVAGRRGALARALAQQAARLQGVTSWHSLTDAERERLVTEADVVVGQWITDAVLVEFLNEWKEK